MKILIIDDEDSIRLSLKIGLKKLGVDVLTAESGEEGLEIFNKENPDLAIVDIKLPGIDGIEVLRRIKHAKPSCIVIMITYLSEVKLAVKAMKDGAYDYFTKPFSISDITDSIKDTIMYLNTKKEMDNKSLDNDMILIGKSPGIQKIRDIIEEIGNMEFNTSILLHGESGTGKEVVAKLIHKSKSNDPNKLIAINCAAIPKELQESELFGYEKGSFTDAKNQKLGLLENANGGTLFLDEISDMDLGLQAKMLRVLQDKKFRRIGGLEEIEFDATIISATNKNLLSEIENGNFREDLYYRLNIVPIEILPLRERKEDLPLLVSSFVNEYNQKLKKNVLSISNDALKAIEEYYWPGNVRELKNVIERLMIFKKGNEITLDDLPDEIFNNKYSEENSLEYFGLEEAEKDTIEKFLHKHDWNITKTANELGISRQTLRKKIQKYELGK